MDVLILDGSSLSMDCLVHAAKTAIEINLEPVSLHRMADARRILEYAIDTGTPIYGVTRGLGAKASEVLNKNELTDFSKKTLLGRAHTVGEETSVSGVRAAMIVRLNTLLSGHSGARPKLAEHLAACLNANITPVVKSIGSVGVADLLPNSNLGLSLIGEGMMRDGANGRIDVSSRLMLEHGIKPLDLEARDGLALASNSSFVAGIAALNLEEAIQAFNAAQSSAALSTEAFRANLSFLDERALSLRPHKGQSEATVDLRKKLNGSKLFDYTNARRIQDPLSIRNIPQIHGTVCSAIMYARETVEIEINSVSDNPIVITQDQEIISCGLYFTSQLCNAIETVSRAFVHLASAQLARTAKHMDANLTELPSYLTKDGTSSAGLAPIMKVQEALFSELIKAAQPVAIWPSVSASGIEDCVAGAPTAVKSLAEVAKLSMRMSAVEMIVACQAFELRDRQLPVGPFIKNLILKLQSLSPRSTQDQPLGDDIEKIFHAILNGELTISPEKK